MTRTLALLLGLAAAPALAQDQTLSPEATQMAAAIEEAGCLITTRNGIEIQNDLGFTEAQINTAVLELYQLGLLRLEENGASGRLYTAACQ